MTLDATLHEILELTLDYSDVIRVNTPRHVPSLNKIMKSTGVNFAIYK